MSMVRQATVCSSLILCESNWDKPLIGFPIPERELHVLDKDKNPVKMGKWESYF